MEVLQTGPETLTPVDSSRFLVGPTPRFPAVGQFYTQVVPMFEDAPAVQKAFTNKPKPLRVAGSRGSNGK